MDSNNLLETILYAEENQYKLSNEIILDCVNNSNLFEFSHAHGKARTEPIVNTVFLNGEYGANGLQKCNILWRRSLIYDDMEFNMRLQDCVYPIGTDDNTFLSSKTINDILKLPGQTHSGTENLPSILSELLQPNHCTSESYNVSSRPTTIEKFIKYFSPVGIVIGKTEPENQLAIWDSVDTQSCNVLVDGPLSAVSSKTTGMDSSFITQSNPRLILPKDRLDIDIHDSSSSRVFLYVIIMTCSKTAPQSKNIPLISNVNHETEYYLTSYDMRFCISSRGVYAIINDYIKDLKHHLKPRGLKLGILGEVACFRLGFFPSFHTTSLHAEYSDNYIFENFNIYLHTHWKYKSLLINCC
jgi:hypothetical protein